MPPPTPTPSPSDASPLQPGGVPFQGAPLVARRLFDEHPEQEPVLQPERAPYRGPSPVNMDLPEPYILKDDGLVSNSCQGPVPRQALSMR